MVHVLSDQIEDGGFNHYVVFGGGSPICADRKNVIQCLNESDAYKLANLIDSEVDNSIQEEVTDLTWKDKDLECPQADYEVIASCDDDVKFCTYRENCINGYFELPNGDIFKATHWMKVPEPF